MIKTNFLMILLFMLITFPVASGGNPRSIVIEDFDSGEVELFSFEDQDEQSNFWVLNSSMTYDGSPFALTLFGNTWKTQPIAPFPIDSNTVWQVASYQQSIGEIQGFGVMDSVNNLLYSFAGEEEVVPEDWIWVYQGAFPEDEWNLYQLPIGEDWLAKYGYLPEITDLIYLNDRDSTSSGIVYFDQIMDITEDLPMAPAVEIGYTPSRIYRNPNGERSVDVAFYSEIYDPDSEDHSYFWAFGDDSTSTLPNPVHTYIVEDDHPYTVRLNVVDSTNQWGFATCEVIVDDGESSFPITMNFVGDIMLARRYEEEGGVIETMGVEAIFEPTLSVLGEAADITVANLECPLTNQGEPHPSKSYVFRGAPEYVSGIVYAGIDVVTLANNHTLDFGLDGLLQTQAVLDSNSILHSGAGENSYQAYLPLFYSESGINFCFLAACDRTGQYSNNQPYLNAGFNKPGFANETEFDLLKQIAFAEDKADYIIAELHAGYEYEEYPYDGESVLLNDGMAMNNVRNEIELLSVPRSSDVALRHLLIDNGADAVICHHPHVLQGIEVYNGKVIAHSLGNFAFDQNLPETFPTVILNTKIDASGFYEYTITPVFIDDYIPKPATGELGIHILDHLATLSKGMDTYLQVDRESSVAEVILDQSEMELSVESVDAPFELTECDSGYWLSPPIKLERNGNLQSMDDITPAENNWSYRLGKPVIWFGNFEEEGCTLWEIDEGDEYYDESEFYAGSRSMAQERALNPVEIETKMEKRMDIDAEKAHTLFGYMKAQEVNETTMEITYHRYRTLPYVLMSENIGVTIEGDSDWEFYHKQLTIPGETNYFNIKLKSRGSILIPESYTWFDNVGLIEWTNWQAFDGYPQEIENPNEYYFVQIKTETQAESGYLSYSEINYDYEPSTFIGSTQTHSPKRIDLHQNYPNPFNPKTTIRYTLPKRGQISLKIYDVTGRLVKTLVDETQGKGYHSIVWNGKDERGRRVASGVYFYQLSSKGFSETKRLVLLR